MHTHVLFQHVLPGKGLSTLLTGMAFHTYKQTQQCLKALAHRRFWTLREGPEDLEWTQVGQEDVLQVAGEARMKAGEMGIQPRCGCLCMEPGRLMEE